MPVDLFEKYGIDPAENDPHDLFQSNGIAPPAKNSMSMNSGHPDIQNILSQVGSAALNVGEGIGQGVKGAADSLVNFPAQIANVVLPKSMQLPLFQSGEGTGYDIGKFVGDVGSFAAGSGSVNAIRGVAESLPVIGKAAKWLGGESFTQGLARRALGSAGYGATQKDDNRTGGAIESGALSVALDSILRGSSKLLPKNLFKSSLSNTDLMENLNAAKGTNTPLGDVIGSAPLKKTYENLLSKIPFSSVDDQMSGEASNIRNRSEKLVNQYLGGTQPSEVNNNIAKGLMSAYSKQQSAKNALYNEADNIADGIGFKVQPENFFSSAQKYRDIINSSEFLKFDPSEKKMLAKLSAYKDNPAATASGILPNGLPQYEGKMSEPINLSLKEANLLSSRINNMSRKYAASPLPEDRNVANVLKNLGGSLKKDIKQSIESNGDESLKKAYSMAEVNYKEKFLPYLDKEVYKYASGEKSPDDLVNTFIKTGSSSDKSGKISKLMNVLDDKTKNLIGYSYLSRSMKGTEDNRHIDPMTLKNLWSDTKLGQNQKKALFPDRSDRKEMDTISKLAQMNSEGLTRMVNPKTGARMPEFLTGAGGFMAGGIPGAIGGLAASSLVGKGLSKILTSEKYRESLVKKMITNQKLSRRDHMVINALSQSLLNQGMQ